MKGNEMTDKKTEPSKADLCRDRKAGMQIAQIARKYDMDKMDVRDAVKKVERVAKKPVEEPQEPSVVS